MCNKMVARPLVGAGRSLARGKPCWVQGEALHCALLVDEDGAVVVREFQKAVGDRDLGLVIDSDVAIFELGDDGSVVREDFEGAFGAWEYGVVNFAFEENFFGG